MISHSISHFVCHIYFSFNLPCLCLSSNEPQASVMSMSKWVIASDRFSTTPFTHQPHSDTFPHQPLFATLLTVLFSPGSQLKSRSFHKLYERISRVGHVKVNDSNGSQRPVWVTYRRDYPIENNDWGDFQTHRRVLGIITIGLYGSVAHSPRLIALNAYLC